MGNFRQDRTIEQSPALFKKKKIKRKGKRKGEEEGGGDGRRKQNLGFT